MRRAASARLRRQRRGEYCYYAGVGGGGAGQRPSTRTFFYKGGDIGFGREPVANLVAVAGRINGRLMKEDITVAGRLPARNPRRER